MDRSDIKVANLVTHDDKNQRLFVNFLAFSLSWSGLEVWSVFQRLRMTCSSRSQHLYRVKFAICSSGLRMTRSLLDKEEV